jgi:hypothetical protein
MKIFPNLFKPSINGWFFFVPPSAVSVQTLLKKAIRSIYNRGLISRWKKAFPDAFFLCPKTI